MLVWHCVQLILTAICMTVTVFQESSFYQLLFLFTQTGNRQLLPVTYSAI